LEKIPQTITCDNWWRIIFRERKADNHRHLVLGYCLVFTRDISLLEKFHKR